MTRPRLFSGRHVAGLLVGGLLLTGCASGAEPGAAAGPASSGSSPAASSSSSGPASANPRVKGTEIKVSIRDGKVSPPTRRVKIDEGTRVRLLVTSDVADEVHVHGFGIERAVAPGRVLTIRFVADQTGLFEVETHDTELQLVQLEVR